MRIKTMIIFSILLSLIITATASAARPVIKSDRSYFDINSGLYILNGNVNIQVGNRTITAGQAKVNMATLEVWGTGGVTVTQDELFFSGNNVYVYGSEQRAKIDGGILFRRPDLTITADRVDYSWDSKTAVFEGNVQITQSGVTRCVDKATYNVRTNVFM
ncbi:MAG: LptA/OstA family protein [Negativicutes bacterium]|nr:LptA/OstA family protein [Negativicutes bacterium]